MNHVTSRLLRLLNWGAQKSPKMMGDSSQWSMSATDGMLGLLAVAAACGMAIPTVVMGHVQDEAGSF